MLMSVWSRMTQLMIYLIIPIFIIIIILFIIFIIIIIIFFFLLVFNIIIFFYLFYFSFSFSYSLFSFSPSISFIYRGVEERIISDLPLEDRENITILQSKMIESSGKLSLLDKLLPRLFSQGHKVLILSQMVRVLNIIEDFLRFKG